MLFFAMKRNEMIWCFLLVFTIGFAQQKKSYKIHTIAFYNLENLFDTIDDPQTRDEFSPMLQLKSDVSNVYLKKINNMAYVLADIGKSVTKVSPTLIGLAEVENESVLKDLLQTTYFEDQSYSFIHADSPDWRGIDVALLYNQNRFEPSNFMLHRLVARDKHGYPVRTRHQLVVVGYLENETIFIIVNHWPSQKGGRHQTEKLRLGSAELTCRIIDSIHRVQEQPKIIVMGDFNDNPTAKSVQKISNYQDHGIIIDKEMMYNPFEKMYKKGYGTLGFNDRLDLFDQLILSTNMQNKSYEDLQLYKAGIYNPSYLITKQGSYKGYPFRSFSNQSFTGGYSDHYPVYVYLIKTEE